MKEKEFEEESELEIFEDDVGRFYFSEVENGTSGEEGYRGAEIVKVYLEKF